MKYTSILLTLFLLHFSAFAQTDERKADSKISEVTVFLQGAQVTRDARIGLQKGKNVMIFRGLAAGIDPKSIQVSAPDNVLINSVNHEINYLERDRQNPRLTAISDSVQLLKDLLAANTSQRSVLTQEKKMVLANQELGSEKTGITMVELQKAADFFRRRLTDIEDRLIDIRKSDKRYKKARTRLNRQYAELNGQRNRPSNDIRVIFNSFNQETVSVSLRYIVRDAGWVPGYDLRAKDTQSPIQLDYRADVFQTTGVDWSDVKLTLSSGNPSQGGTQPTLSAWNLYVQQPNSYGYKGKRDVMQKMEEKTVAMSDEEEADEPAAEVTGVTGGAPANYGDAITLADYTKVTEGATTAEFAISILQTILSDGKPAQVSVQSSELPATYEHFAVPKLDKDAFLLARITDWEGLNLLPGDVQVFFEGTYVTQSSIDPNFTRDTLDFSLGRDKKVVISRTQLKDFTKVKTIGFNREKTFAYEIKVRNTKAERASLRLEDQIPVSQDKDITVKMIESSGAKYDEATGKMHWDLQLQPGESKTIRLMFSVKHPKNKYVPGI